MTAVPALHVAVGKLRGQPYQLHLGHQPEMTVSWLTGDRHWWF